MIQPTKVYVTFLVGWVSERKRFGIVLMEFLNTWINKVNFFRCIYAVMLFDKVLCLSPQDFEFVMLWITNLFSLDCTCGLNSVFER